MSAPESTFWRAVKAAAPPRTFLQRVENRHGGGVPDCSILLDSLPFWIELKVAKSAKLQISPHQVAWHTSFWARGGLSFFLAKAPSQPRFVLFRGAQAIDLAQEPWSEVQHSGFEDLDSAWSALRVEVADHYLQICKSI